MVHISKIFHKFIECIESKVNWLFVDHHSVYCHSEHLFHYHFLFFCSRFNPTYFIVPLILHILCGGKPRLCLAGATETFHADSCQRLTMQPLAHRANAAYLRI